MHAVWCVNCERMCELFALCVCVSAASICSSKQSWQANLIWPGKGQPHSNCLSLTLCIDAPSSFCLLPAFFSPYPSFLHLISTLFCIIIFSFAPIIPYLLSLLLFCASPCFPYFLLHKMNQYTHTDFYMVHPGISLSNYLLNITNSLTC